MITSELLSYVKEGKLNNALARIYGEENVQAQIERYTEAISDFKEIYGEREVNLFSVPGRSEISGMRIRNFLSVSIGVILLKRQSRRQLL